MTDEVFIHNKTGNFYKLLGYGHDSESIKLVALYARYYIETDITGPIWVRDADEFFDKFSKY